MHDTREIQESQADARTARTVHEAQDTREQLIAALKAVDRELQRAREVADTLPRAPYRPRRRWWPWSSTFSLYFW